MTSLASALHEMVDDLREDVACVVAPQDTPAAVSAARTHLAEIATLAETSKTVSAAARHVGEAIDRVLEIKEQALLTGSPLDAEQASRAVNLIEDPLSELTHAVNALP